MAATIRGTKIAMRQHQAFVRRSIAINRHRGGGRRVAGAGAVASSQARRDQLRRSLGESLGVQLDCTPYAYATGGSALFIGSNWVGPDGMARLVLACDTHAPGSGRPVTAILWTEDEIAQVDLSSRPLSAFLEQGRLFVFESTIAFQNGEQYAVLPAGFHQSQDGPPGLWTFPTAGSYRGRPFFVGRGGAGTFADSALQSVLAVRPSGFDAASRHWFWAGRSSARVGDRIQLQIADILGKGSDGRRLIELPPLKPAGDYAIVACDARDDRGDPLGVVDTLAQAGCGIIRIEGTFHLVGRPNQLDQKRRPVLALRAKKALTNEWVITLPYREGGNEVEVEIPANVTTKDGSRWFIRYPNVKDRTHGLPLIRIPLRPLSSS